MKKKLLVYSLIALTFTTLVSCGNSFSIQSTPDEYDAMPTDFDHYFSNKISFADLGISVEGKTFLEDKIELVSKKGYDGVGLKSVTDGDTAVFYTSGMTDTVTNTTNGGRDYYSLRFLAIDTPESTSSINPWGKAASKYAKDLLYNAEGIIVDATSIDTSMYSNLVDTFTQNCRLDSNGSRWLGLVWYCPEGKDPTDLENYRSYQLDMIEEGYSFYSANYNSEMNGNPVYVYQIDQANEPILYSRYQDSFGSMTLNDIFFEADIRTRTLNKRYTGNEIDPNYDYDKTPTEVSITEAKGEMFEELSNNCKYVELKGVITSFIGNNFFISDGTTSLYVYMGINGSSLGSEFKVGDTIKVRGRLSTFGGQKQLTDIIFKRETFTKVTDPDEMIAMPTPINMVGEGTEIDLWDDYHNEAICGNPEHLKYKPFTLEQLEALEGQLVTTRLHIDYRGNVNSGSYTLYGSEGVEDLLEVGYEYPDMSIRVNGDLTPGYSVEEGNAYVGEYVEVTGVLGLYMEEDRTELNEDGTNYASYQIIVGNRPVDEDGDPLSDITVIDDPLFTSADNEF